MIIILTSQMKIIFTILNIRIIALLLLQIVALELSTKKTLKDSFCFHTVLRDFFHQRIILLIGGKKSRVLIGQRERKRLFSHAFLFLPWCMSHTPIRYNDSYLNLDAQRRYIIQRILTYRQRKNLFISRHFRFDLIYKCNFRI